MGKRKLKKLLSPEAQLAKTARRELRRIASSTAAGSEVLRVIADRLAALVQETSKIYGAFDCLLEKALELSRLHFAPAPVAPAPVAPAPVAPAPSSTAATVETHHYKAPDFEPGRRLYFANGDCWELTGQGSGAFLVKIHAGAGLPARETSVTRNQWAQMLAETAGMEEENKAAACVRFASQVRNYPAPGDAAFTVHGGQSARATVKAIVYAGRNPAGVELAREVAGGADTITRSLGWWRELCDTPGASLFSSAMGEYVAGEMLTVGQELDAAEIEKAGRA